MIILLSLIYFICFIETLDCPSINKIDCGIPGTQEPECVEKGCCWGCGGGSCCSCPSNSYLKSDEILLSSKRCYSTTPEGYYLGNRVYEKCYEKCKFCTGSGGVNDNNCIKCKDGYYLVSINKNCYETCPQPYNKIIIQKNECTNDCKNYDTYQFEYDNKCYINCPEGKHEFYDNNDKKCYSETPEGYYLDNISQKYKKCFMNCKTCRLGGDEVNHNCEICKNEYIYKYGNNCLSQCPLNTKTDNDEKKCFESCYDYKFEYNNICYIDCPDGTYRLFNDKKICSDSLPDNYYFDNNDNIYKPCFKNCKKCYGEGNDTYNNCSECISGFILLNEPNQENNCFQCDNFYYINDINGLYFCTKNYLNCPSNYQNFIPEKRKCINKCKNDNIYKYLYNNTCFYNCPNDTYCKDENNKICYNYNEPQGKVADSEVNSFLSNLEEKSLQELIKKTLNNGEQYSINVTDDTFIIASTLEKSSINIGKCEDDLIKIYDINKNVSLIVIEIQYRPNNTKIPIIEYLITHPLNFSVLNLSYCNNSEVTLSIPVIIDENSLYLYDPNSNYYNDKCNSFTTENGTDIILKDRQQEFVDKNLSLCENKCRYLGYNISNKKSSCVCEAKTEIQKISELAEKPDKLSNEFSSKQDSDSTINIMSFKCASVVFSIDGLKKNISSYLLLSTIIYYLLSICLFIKCGFRLLIMKIKKIVEDKRKIKFNKMNLQKNNKNMNNKQQIKKAQFKKNAPPKKRDIKFMGDENPKKRYQRVLRSDSNSMFKSYKLNLFSENQSKTNNNKNTTNKVQNKMNKFMSNIKQKYMFFPKNYFNVYELNTMNYLEAVIYDKRSCCSYYLSLIKTKHPLLFGFCPINDNNSLIVKSCIFFETYHIGYFINYLFINENTIHRLYEENGTYDVFYFLPQIGISFVISNLIAIIIKYIFLSESNIKEVKMKKTYFEANSIFYKTKNQLVRKYTFFYIFGLIFLVIIWVVLSGFGAVYRNTQIILFINTSIYLLISFIYPFIINIIPSVLRICSLSFKSKQLSCIYNLSKFFQLL